MEFSGKPLLVEIGRLAGQAGGSCYVQYGKSALLVTATMSLGQKEVDYMPLSVEYVEKILRSG